MKVYCTISGLVFDIVGFPKAKSAYLHPIFAMPHKDKYLLYSDYTKGRLTPVESYLLFVAFLEDTDSVIWDCPVSVNPTAPSTQSIIANYFDQLLDVLNKSAAIAHPRFKQPKFRMTIESSNLQSVGNWIKAWQENIEAFKIRHAGIYERNKLVKIENRLKALIASNTDPIKYGHILADWAHKAADFPAHKQLKWQAIIKDCYHQKRMFDTPLGEIKALLEFCECNIEADSLYFRELIKTINTGIINHTDYLGIGDLGMLQNVVSANNMDSGKLEAISSNDSKLIDIIHTAPASEPKKSDYANLTDYIQAKSAYMVAKSKTRLDALEQQKKITSEILAKRKNKLDL